MFVSSLIHEKDIENCLFQKENHVVLNGKQCQEKTMYIDKVRAQSSQFSYTDVMINMKLAVFETPPYIYHTECLQEDRRQRAAKAGSAEDSLLDSNMTLTREAWIRIWGWYKDAMDPSLPPERVSVATMTAEQVKL